MDQQEHEKLFKRLQILFAGYNPPSDSHDNTVEYFIDQILFKAYHYVIELKELLKKYQNIKQKNQNSPKLLQLKKKLNEAAKREKKLGVEMSKVQIEALSGQMKIISPYQNKISNSQQGVFNNLEYFIDIASGIQKIHLKKANQLLPNVFTNLINRSNIKELLGRDLKQTQENYASIEKQVNSKVNAVENTINFYENMFDRLENQLNKI